MGHTFQNHLIETYRIHKQTTIDPLDVPNLQTLRMQPQLVYLVSIEWLLVHWSHDDARNLQVLRILQSLIDPSLHHR